MHTDFFSTHKVFFFIRRKEQKYEYRARIYREWVWGRERERYRKTACMLHIFTFFFHLAAIITTAAVKISVCWAREHELNASRLMPCVEDCAESMLNDIVDDREAKELHKFTYLSNKSCPYENYYDDYCYELCHSAAARSFRLMTSRESLINIKCSLHT